MKAVDLKPLFLQSHGKLLAYIRGFVPETHQAEELMQESFLLLLAAVRAGEAIESPQAFLYRIARNLCLNRIKRGKAETRYRLQISRARDAHLNPVDAVAHEEAVKDLHDALLSLPEEQQEIVALKTWQAQTFESIAAIMALPMATVTRRYYAALQSLAEVLRAGDE